VSASPPNPLRVWNGRAFASDDVPVIPSPEFNTTIARLLRERWRLVGLFGLPGPELPLRAWGVLADPDGGSLAVLATELGAEYASLTPTAPQAARFERELCEQFGVLPVGHPWLKPVRSHAPWGPGSYVLHARGEEVGVGYPFFRMEGQPVHEVAVGPVHAGIIEPGHFRFQCHGEIVHHLEIVLGYQHRGLERTLLGGPHRVSRSQVEELAGDSTIAHALAYAESLEALGACPVPPRAQALRAVALELERLAAHTGDLGALAGDIAFLPTAAYCGRLRGAFLNLTAELCGNRFGRGFITAGGVTSDISPADAERLLATLDTIAADLRSAMDLFFASGSVLARLEGVGGLARDTAVALGMVGVAARACGLPIDARHDHPTGLYRMAHIPVATSPEGDVHARAVVRWLEAQRSVEFLRDALRQMPAGPARVPCGSARAGGAVVTLVEGWRGEVAHVALTDREGRFARYKVIDPSFRNWAGLEQAMRGQQISDFPLCNKSFNLSYSGHDL